MFPDLFRDDVFRLETRRLWLRWPRASDAEAITALVSEREVAEMTARIPYPYPPGAARAYVLQAREANAEGEALALVVTPVARPTEPLGFVSVKAGASGRPELGYCIGRPFWGHGMATEAARALIDAFFGYTDHDGLDAAARVINPASRRVLERCGFAYQGSGLQEMPARGGLIPVDHFRLDRRGWESLKSWSGMGLVPVRARGGAELAAC